MKVKEQLPTKQTAARMRVKSGSTKLYRMTIMTQKQTMNYDFPAQTDQEAKDHLRLTLKSYAEKTGEQVHEIGLYVIGKKIL